MKVRKRCLAASLCILLSLPVFVFWAQVGPARAFETEETEMHEEGAASSLLESAEAWASESEEEYQEGEYQEQLREEMSEEDEEGEEGSAYENAPTGEEHESYTEESPDEESSHMTPEGDDDLAQSQAE
ncbi:MAG: hypothetical protein SWE60_17795 [Thermodesulfobacteriota bacterium]|nr:hypothetical protein [Thermodesulfobacteriota bacterium]